jgi:hypothetical protein
MLDRVGARAFALASAKQKMREREENICGKKRQLFPYFTAHTENLVPELNFIQQGISKVYQDKMYLWKIKYHFLFLV